MIDPVDLPFVEHGKDLPVQRHRRGEVVAERLLDHHPPVSAFGLARDTRGGKTLDDPAEEMRCRRKIEHHVAASMMAALQFAQPIRQAQIGRRILKFACEVVASPAQPFAGRDVDTIG